MLFIYLCRYTNFIIYNYCIRATIISSIFFVIFLELKIRTRKREKYKIQKKNIERVRRNKIVYENEREENWKKQVRNFNSAILKIESSEVYTRLYIIQYVWSMIVSRGMWAYARIFIYYYFYCEIPFKPNKIIIILMSQCWLQ